MRRVIADTRSPERARLKRGCFVKSEVRSTVAMEMDVPDQNPNTLSAYVVADTTIADVLERVRSAARRLVPSDTTVGVMMAIDLRRRRFAFSDGEPHAALQRRSHADLDDDEDGPGFDVLRSGEAVIISDSERGGPYPAFRQIVAGQGLRNVACVPMVAGGQVVATLDLYSSSPDVFDETIITEASAFADIAGHVLLNHRAHWDLRSECANLERALLARATIEQAKGIVVADTGCTPDEAFSMLRTRSQHTNVKVQQIAADMVSTKRRASAKRRASTTE